MRLIKIAVFALSLLASSLAAHPAKADWYRGGWGGPRVIFHVGPSFYPHYGYRPYFYGPRAYYARPFYGVRRPYLYGYPRPYGPRVYFPAPVLGFGITVR